MNLLPVLVDARNAYEAHDRDAMERTLQRLQVMLLSRGRTPLRHLDPPALANRRAEVACELADIDVEILRRQSPLT